MASSQDVIRSVSKKLKYYFEVKRLEDGFDLTGPDCPKLDHPPLRARPTLMYDGLHDKPLKHYFNSDVRAALTQFRVPEGNKGREKAVKKKVVKCMKKYQYITPNLPDTYYSYSRGQGRTLRPEAQPHRLARSKQQHKGGYPVLRSVPSHFLTRGEARRLINVASRLVVASEVIDLKEKEKEREARNERKRQEQRSRASSESKLSKRSSSATSVQTMPTSSDRSRSRRSTSSNASVSEGNVSERSQADSKRESIKHSEESDDEKEMYPSDASSIRSGHSPRPPDYERPSRTRVYRHSRTSSKSRSSRSSKSSSSSSSSSDESETPRPYLGKYDEASRTPSPSDRSRSGSEEKQELRPVEKATQEKQEPRPAEKATSLSEESSSSSESERSSRRRTPSPAVKVDVERTADSRRSSAESRPEEVVVQEDGTALADGDPMDHILEKGNTGHYEIHVFTGRNIGASTKSPVSIILCGDKGRSTDIPLTESKTFKACFQQGNEDIFDVECCHVGPLRKIVIGHDGTGFGNGWFLEKVVVRDVYNKIEHEIAAHKWHSHREDDRKTRRQYTVDSSNTYTQDDTETIATSEDTERSAVSSSARDGTDRQSETKSSHKESDINQSTNHTSIQTLPSKTASHEEHSFVEDSDSTSTYTFSQKSTSQSSGTRDRGNGNKPVIVVGSSAPRTTKDDFFDQDVREDYSPAIESVSQVTEQDNRDDFRSSQDTADQKDQQPPPRTRRPGTSDSLDSRSSRRSRGSRGSRGSHSGHSSRSSSDSSDSDSSDGSDVHRRSRGSLGSHDSKHDRRDGSGTESTDSERLYPLHVAVRRRQLQKARAVAEKDPNLKTSLDQNGKTPLHIASAEGQDDIVQWLTISCVDLNVETPTHFTALHLAVNNGHTECVKILCTMGADLDYIGPDQKTPLHLAVKGGYSDIVHYLLSHGVKVQCKDIMGKTALDYAQEMEHRDIERFLRERKDKESDGQTLPSIRENSTTGDDESTSTTPRGRTFSDSDFVHLLSTTVDEKDADDKDGQQKVTRPMSAKGARGEPRRTIYDSDSSGTTSDSESTINSSEEERRHTSPSNQEKSQGQYDEKPREEPQDTKNKSQKEDIDDMHRI